jgi:hypothetical protein
MSLTEVSIGEVVKKQYKYKLKSYLSIFTSLIMIQLLAMFFSSSGSGMFGTSTVGYSIHITYYSGNLVIGFSMLWAFISGILINTKAYRNDDFAFVTNRLVSNLSNIAFIITASIVAGISAMLSSTLLKVVKYFLVKDHYMVGNTETPYELLLGMVTASFYILVIFALGYFVGTLTQLHRIFAMLIPVLFIGTLFFGGRVTGLNRLVFTVVKDFIAAEPSVILFILKIVMISLLLFLGSIVISNRMEVRK